MTRTLLSRCYERRQCGFAPNCVCDVDPTDPRDVAEWGKLAGMLPDILDRLKSIKSACTQKTFLHSPDWREGKQIIQDTIAAIQRLRDAGQGGLDP